MFGIDCRRGAFAAFAFLLPHLVAAQSLLTAIPVQEPPERMAMTPDGSRIYAVGKIDNNVTVIDTQTDTVAAVIPRPGDKESGDRPDDIVISRDGTRVYVVSGSMGRLTAIDSATNDVLAHIPMGSNASSLVVTPDGSKLYVSIPGNLAVVVVDTTTFAPVAAMKLAVPALAGTMVVHPNGSRVYVADAGSVNVISTATDTVVATIPANAFRLAISPDGSRLYLHSQFASRIDVVDTATNTVIQQFPSPGSGADPEVITVSADGKHVYATHFSGQRISALDTTTNTVVSVPLGVPPVGVATSPDNSTAFVATTLAGGLRWLRVSDNTITATLPLSSDSISGEVLLVTPDSAKLYAPCSSNVCVFGTGISTLRTVAIDIKPEGTPNSINPRSHGVIPVALLGAADFDVNAVDAASIRFGAKGTEATARQVSWADVNGDGNTDLVFHFETRELGLQCGDTEAALTGAMLDGQKLRGTDSVRTVGCR